MMVGMGVLDRVLRRWMSLVFRKIPGAVGLTEVDGAFTLGSEAGYSGGVSIGATLGGLLVVMILVRLMIASTWSSFCFVVITLCCSRVSLRACSSSCAAWSVRSACDVVGC